MCIFSEGTEASPSYLMSSSVTTKALHRGCVVLSHTPGFFSTAAVSCPVTGAGLVCRALAMADSSVLSEHAGPTPEQRKTVRLTTKTTQLPFMQGCDICGSLCRPLGRSIVFTSSSAISKVFKPLSFLSQKSWRDKWNKVRTTAHLHVRPDSHLWLHSSSPACSASPRGFLCMWTESFLPRFCEQDDVFGGLLVLQQKLMGFRLVSVHLLSASRLSFFFIFSDPFLYFILTVFAAVVFTVISPITSRPASTIAEWVINKHLCRTWCSVNHYIT